MECSKVGDLKHLTTTNLKKNWGVIVSSLLAVFIGARFLSFSVILPAEEFADLAIGIALAGFSFLLIPKVGDLLDYSFLSSASADKAEYELNLSCAIQLSIIFILLAFIIVWVTLRFIYEIESVHYWVCAFGILVSSSLNSIILPYYKANNRYQEFLLIEFFSAVGGVAGIVLFYFFDKVWMSLIFSYVVMPILAYCYAFKKTGAQLPFASFIDFRQCVRIVLKNKVIFANGYVSSAIKACNEHGIILLLGVWAGKSDVAIFSVSKSLLAPIRSIQNFYQADVYRKLRNERNRIREVLDPIIADCRIRALFVFLVTFALSFVAYFFEFYLGFEKYPGIYVCIFLLGLSASVTISAIWTFPLALKFDLTTDRTKAAFLRLNITFFTLLMLPSYIGGGLALLAATVITRLTLDLRLKKKVLSHQSVD